MIWTKYNHIFRSNKFGTLLYNSLTNTFLNIGEDISVEISKIKSDPNGYPHSADSKLYDTLLNMGVLFDGENNDIKNHLKLFSSLEKYNKDYVNLTIIPTLDCNFSCSYCYEKNHLQPIYMNNETEDKIVEFIDQNYKDSKLLNIAWFGGEPLLAFDRIRSLTQKISKLNIKFKSEIVTNGYLLDLEKIIHLDELKISNIQITLDGTEETHNKRRPHNENGKSYNAIVNNVEKMFCFFAANNLTINLDLRINVDHENKSEYAEVYNRLKLKFPLANIYPGILKGEASIEKCNNPTCSFNHQETADFYMDQFERFEECELNYYPTWYGMVNCTATRYNDYVIGPVGEIYTCWHDIGDTKMIMGNIHNEPVISNQILFGRFLEGIDPFENTECKNCFYLPICGGGCPYDQVLNKYYGKNIETCIMHKGMKTLEKMLETHYALKLKYQPENIEKLIF